MVMVGASRRTAGAAEVWVVKVKVKVKAVPAAEDSGRAQVRIEGFRWDR